MSTNRVGTPSAPPRLEWVDHARGLGILLVVVGHVLRGLMASSVLADDSTAIALDAWIYAFHMPLFFLLAGLFLPRALKAPPREFFENKTRSLAYTYLLWSTLQTLVQIALSRFTNHPASLLDLLDIVWLPVMQFWFLAALIVILEGMHALRQLGASMGVVLLSSVVLWGLAPRLGLSWGVANQALTYAPYVALGALGMPWLSQHLARLKTAPALSCAATGYALVAALQALSFHDNHFFAPLPAALGTAATLCLAVALARSGGVAWLVLIGQRTLEIYVAHTLASAGTRIVLQKLLHVHTPWVHTVAGIAAGLVFPVCMAMLCDRWGIRYAFRLPKRKPDEAPKTVAFPEH